MIFVVKFSAIRSGRWCRQARDEGIWSRRPARAPRTRRSSCIPAHMAFAPAYTQPAGHGCQRFDPRSRCPAVCSATLRPLGGLESRDERWGPSQPPKARSPPCRRQGVQGCCDFARKIVGVWGRNASKSRGISKATWRRRVVPQPPGAGGGAVSGLSTFVFVVYWLVYESKHRKH